MRTENLLNLEGQPRKVKVAMPSLKLTTRNIIGVSLILVISFLLIIFILLPNVIDLIESAVASQGAWEWLVVFGSILLMGFLIAVPISLLIQSFMEYRNVRDLNRFGVMAKGSLVNKWVDESGGKPVYYVRYKYSAPFNTSQTVDRETFQQLRYDETLFILHLENLPHISQLDLD